MSETLAPIKVEPITAIYCTDLKLVEPITAIYFTDMNLVEPITAIYCTDVKIINNTSHFGDDY